MNLLNSHWSLTDLLRKQSHLVCFDESHSQAQEADIPRG